MPRRNKSVPSERNERTLYAKTKAVPDASSKAHEPTTMPASLSDDFGSISAVGRGKRNWYAERRFNKKALQRRALRQAKYAMQDGVAAEPAIYSKEAVIEMGLGVGTAAEIHPPSLSMLSGSSMLRTTARSAYERAIVNHLVVGDDVVFENKEGMEVALKGMLERRSKLVRLRADSSRASPAKEHVIAANIDLALIVASVANPPFHPKLIDRYLVMCQYGNVSPSICLTKTDLGPNPNLSAYIGIGLPVFRVSNATREGIAGLAMHLRGRRSILVGHSGVGKSSLANNLLEKETIPIGAVGGKSGRGRHTTSGSSLHVIGPDTFLIDTPGIRSLGLWRIGGDALRFYFPEFGKFSKSCKDRNCSHSHEPECEVKDAVGKGEIARERYDSYMRLLEEQA